MKAEDIYFYAPKARIDTAKVFTITKEGDHLRVKNKNVSCLLKNLTEESFHDIYNEYFSHLNLNFSPVKIDSKIYRLTKDKQEALEQEIIMRRIYFYTVNNLEIEVRREDFTSPGVADCVIALLDKKYGKDTKISLTIGAHLLRRDYEDYCQTVKGRRRHYDR